MNQGYAVFAMDIVGHGKSEGSRGEIISYTDIVNDFSSFYDIVNGIIEGDLFIFGQGIGAAIALIYYEYNHKYLSIFEEVTKGIVLCGCPFDYQVDFLSHLKKGSALAKVTPQLPYVPVDYTTMTKTKKFNLWKTVFFDDSSRTLYVFQRKSSVKQPYK